MLPEQEAAMWFFSTIAQTLGAIVAVVGMLTVYKLDRIGNTQKRIFDEIRDIVELNQDLFSPELRPAMLLDMGPQSWVNYHRRHFSESGKFYDLLDEKQDQDLADITRQLEEAERQRNVIKRWFKISLAFNLCVIFLAVACLRFYNYVLNELPYPQVVFLFILLVCLALTGVLSFTLMGRLKKSECNAKKTSTS